MKRIGQLLKKDIILGIKDIFIIMEIAFSFLIMLMLLFVVPKDIEAVRTAYIYDATSLISNLVNSNAESAKAEEQKGGIFTKSREEVIEGMKENMGALGIIINEEKNGKYHVELLTQPYTKQNIAKYLEMEMEDLLSMLKPPKGVYPPDVYNAGRITALKEGLRDELPFNKRMLPTILLYMVGIIGLFAMVSLVGQERSEATIRAYKVSPASMWEFLISKHLMLLAVSFCTFSIIYIPIMGFAGYPEALLLMLLMVIFGSCVGVVGGGIFDNPMSAMASMFLVIIVLVLPSVSLFVPLFNPGWIKFIPTYHVLFGLDAAIFPDNNSHIIWQGIGIMAVIDVVCFFISSFVFGKLIRKEA